MVVEGLVKKKIVIIWKIKVFLKMGDNRSVNVIYWLYVLKSLIIFCCVSFRGFLIKINM